MTRGRIDALDGLRAVAILPVIASHSSYPRLESGLLGVDVFFVLSGYLITGLLLRERQRSGRISLGNFYLRRALRLYPALIASILLGIVLLATGILDDKHPVRHAVFALLYLQDFAYGYFGDRGSIWGHTWSLAIEEHFYLVWPLVIIVLGRYGRRVVGLVSIGTAVVLFAVTQLAYPFTDSIPEYTRPEVRGVALLIGCALACIPAPRLPAWCGWAALVAMGAVMLGAAGQGWRATFALAIPAICVLTAVLIVAALSGAGVARLLSTPVLTYIGRISYGLYLYHVLWFEAPLRESYDRSQHALAATVLSFATAVLSYHLLEQPFLRLKDRLHGSRPAAVPVSA